jgi:hypothetical protein
MHPALEYIGKVAGIFDACCIIMFIAVVGGVALQGWVANRFKLPAGHWVLMAIITVTMIFAWRLVSWVSQWIWSLDPP